MTSSWAFYVVRSRRGYEPPLLIPRPEQFENRPFNSQQALEEYNSIKLWPATDLAYKDLILVSYDSMNNYKGDCTILEWEGA